VPNPAYDGAGGLQPKLIARDYGFGPSNPGGFVTLGGARIAYTSWSNLQITATVPSGLVTGAFRTGELAVERCMTAKTGVSPLNATTTGTCADDRKSILGVTLNVATQQMHTARPPRVVNPGQKIQTVIDTARPGDLVLVKPGTYEEMVVMTKPVRLQGYGALSTVINIVTAPSENVQAWLDKVGNLLTSSPDYLLPNQPAMTPPPFQSGDVTAVLGDEGAGVTVLGKNQPTFAFLGLCNGTFATPVNEAYCVHNENFGGLLPVLRPNARIDGFSIVGASNAPGVMLNGYNRFVEISNNKIYTNSGSYAGGIQVGHPGSPIIALADTNAQNANVAIHHNLITQNAGIDAAGGGGIVLGTGSTAYQVTNNFIAGNLAAGQGGGIGHIGLSELGVIDHNAVVFNESFSQGVGTNGGGIYIGGRPPAAGALTPGSGNVRVSNNLIQGNQAAGGDGGGIALQGVNGTDITLFQNPLLQFLRFRVNLFNNVIANNVAGLAGGGIAIRDAAFVDITHNTIVRNDSLATAGAAFTNGPNQSVDQPAGIVTRGYSPLLAAALGGGATYPNPSLVNSIVWQNRSFHFGPLAGGIVIPGSTSPTQYGEIANATQPYWDLAVLGAPAGAQLNPMSSVLTSTTGYHASNSNTAPLFVANYFNGDRRHAYQQQEVVTAIQVPAALDEGGNFIRPQFGPLSLQTAGGASFFGNYHVTTGVAGANLNTTYGGAANVPGTLLFDVDSEPRPAATPHRGADQKQAAVPPVTPIPQ
jgi:hypothetical protein